MYANLPKHRCCYRLRLYGVHIPIPQSGIPLFIDTTHIHYPHPNSLTAHVLCWSRGYCSLCEDDQCCIEPFRLSNTTQEAFSDSQSRYLVLLYGMRGRTMFEGRYNLWGAEMAALLSCKSGDLVWFPSALDFGRGRSPQERISQPHLVLDVGVGMEVCRSDILVAATEI